MNKPTNDKPMALLWVDIETTGLDPRICQILEVGVRCTSPDASEEHARYASVVKPSVLNTGRDCLSAYRMHWANGLLEQVLNSSPVNKGRVAIADELLEFTLTLAGKYRLKPAGTNIWHFDLPAITEYLYDGRPVFTDLLEYRSVDLSTIRHIEQVMGADPYKHRDKGTHRVDDCLDRDIAEYRTFLEGLR